MNANITDNELNLRDYYDVFIKRKYIFLICVIVVTILSIIVTLITPLKYASTAKVIIGQSTETESIFGVPVRWFWEDRKVNNEVEILRTREMAEKSVEFLPEDVRKEILEESGTLNLDEDKYLTNVINSSVRIISLEDTDIILISGTGSSAKIAQGIANALAEGYINENLRLMKEDVSSVKKFIDQQIERVGEELKESEEALKSFKEETGIVAVDYEAREMIKRLVAFDAEYHKAKVNKEVTAQQLKYLKKKISEQQKGLYDDLINLTSPIINQLKNKLIQLEMDISDLMIKGYEKNHLKVKELEDEIEKTRKKLKEEVEQIAQKIGVVDPVSLIQNDMVKVINFNVDLYVYKSKENALKKVVDYYSKFMKDMPVQELQLARLERKKKVNEGLYMMLEEKHEEARIKEAGKVGDARVIERAQLPQGHISPNRRRNVLFGILLGIILGIFAVFLIEFLDNKIRDVDYLKKNIDIPLLGAIPEIKSNKNFKEDEKLSSIIITSLKNKEPLYIEQFNTIRTNLGFISFENKKCCFVVSSSVKGEGKSNIAVNLAISMSMVEKPTILVDCDLRKPVLHKILGFTREPGITEHLLHKEKLENVIHKTEIENLDFLSSGFIPPNPSEIVSSEGFTKMIKILKESYKHIIFDSSPIFPISDAIMLASKADGLILVVKAGHTDKKVLGSVLESLNLAKINIPGIVLNFYNIKANYYKRYHYYTSK